MAGIANYAQGIQPRTHNNGGESDIIARPQLQFANERTVDNIAKQVKDVCKVEKDAVFTKTDNWLPLITAAAAAAVVGIAIFAIIALSATGIGGGLIGVGFLLLGIACYLTDKADTKHAKTQDIELVHLDATRLRVQKAIQQDQDLLEGGVQNGRGQPRGYRGAPVFVPAPQPNQGNGINVW